MTTFDVASSAGEVATSGHVRVVRGEKEKIHVCPRTAHPS